MTPLGPGPELLAIRDPGTLPHSGSRLARAPRAAARPDRRATARVVVAYSGGVDSSLVLRVAHEQLGERALGVIGRSDSYAAHELELALAQAQEIGARIEVVTTGELADPALRRQRHRPLLPLQVRVVPAAATPSRSARAAPWCWTGPSPTTWTTFAPGVGPPTRATYFRHLPSWAFARPTCARPRNTWGFRSSDKPASPCLASRIPYGTPVTAGRAGQYRSCRTGAPRAGLHPTARPPPRRRRPYRVAGG